MLGSGERRYAGNVGLSMQLDLFQGVQKAYAAGCVSNAEVYDHLATTGVVDRTALESKQTIGRSGTKHCRAKRSVRWIQQSMKQLGILEPAGKRGYWQLTAAGKRGLTPAAPNTVLVSFITSLGVALWASCKDVFAKIDEPISLCLSSPPYPLSRARAYGNPTEAEYVDWLCSAMEPIVKHLLPGGSVVLNVSNEIFLPKSPERSMYCERLLIALHDRLGLKLMDRQVWHNPCKAPGPIAYASKQRVHLNVAWEPVYWLSNDPTKAHSNNQRVLEPHNPKHLKMVRGGGERTSRISGDGSQRVKIGAYSNETAGRIPRNLMSVRHNCIDQDRYKAYCRSVGLPSHGASMPLALAKRYVEFLTEPGDLVVDPFGGSLTTAKAAEQAGRRWLTTELMGEYLAGGASRFHDVDGFEDYMTTSLEY